MVSKISLSLRMIPFYILFIVIVSLNFFLGLNGNSFDYWTPMINFPEDIISWFLAGVYVVLLFFGLAYIRAKVVHLSFSNLNREIPQTDTWETIQFLFVILNIFVPIIIGLLLTFNTIDTQLFILLLNAWLICNFIPDSIYYVKWMIVR